MTNEEITILAEQVIKDNPREALRWKNGERGLMKLLSDKVVVQSSYKAHPKLAISILNKLLKQTEL